MPKTSKTDWNKITRIAGVIFGALGVTFGAVALIVMDHYATEWEVGHLENPKSPIYMAVKDIADDSANEKITKAESKMMDAVEAMSSMYMSMKGFGGMTDLAMVEHFKEKLHLADTLGIMLPNIVKAVAYVDEVTVEIDEKYIVAAQIMYDAKTSEPAYFIDYCNKKLIKREILFGRPSGMNLNGNAKRYYYRDRNDKAVLLTLLSNY